MSPHKDSVRELLSVIEAEINFKILRCVISSVKLVYPLKENIYYTQLIEIKICFIFSQTRKTWPMTKGFRAFINT